MRQSIVALVVLAIGLACVPAGAQQEFGNEINAAIDKGVAFLWRLQKDDGSWPQYGGGQHSDHGVGATALVVYALLEAGESAQDERIIKALDYLRGASVSHIYSASLRAVAIQVANEQTNDKYVDALERYVPLVVGAMNRDGAFGYPTAVSATADNSNTQYAALGMMAFANNDSLRKIRQDYWERMKGYWERTANPEDGAWGYNTAGFTGGYYCSVTQPTMTVGGIATLYICEDNLDPTPEIIRAEGVTTPVGIQRGLAWMDQNFWWTLNPAQAADIWQPTLNQTVNPNSGQSLGAERISQMLEWYYYYLYGVERAALASGYKYFGGRDWYREGAGILLDSQITGGTLMVDNTPVDLTGAWVRSSPDANTNPSMLEADTAFSLLFLIRGRQPLLFNKLDWGGDWNNRPRDLAKATHWISRGYEFSVNWQIVTADSPVDDWRDAPFMYISGKKAFGYSAYSVAKLQDYVFKGGTIFSAGQHEAAEFNQSIREFYKTAFPRYELEEVPADHPFYSTPWPVDPAVARVFMVHNGVRPLAIHVEGDISLAWQRGDYAAEPWAFDLLANIAIHCCGALYDLPARGVNLWEGVDLGSVGSGTSAPGGGDPFVPGGGGAPAANYIYFMVDGQLYLQPASSAGATADMGGGRVITIPRDTDPGQTTVYCQTDDCYVSVPNEALNASLPCPVSQGQSFTATAGSRRANESRGQFDSGSQFNAGDDAMWQDGGNGVDDAGDSEDDPADTPDPEWIMVLMNQEYTWQPDSAVGQTVQSSDGTSYKVPDPDDEGQITVLCEPMDVYVSVHESLVGYTVDRPDGNGQFTIPGGGPTVIVPSDTPLPPAPRPGRAPMPPDPYAEVSSAGYPADAVFVIRLKVAGDLANSNPEPLAWPRVAGMIEDEIDGITVAPIGPIEVKDLASKANELSARLAVFTGTESFSFSEAERDAIKAFVEGGGTLFVDAAGGSKEFEASFTDEINGMFRKGRRSISLRELAVSAPIYQLDGFKIPKVSYRRITARTMAPADRNSPSLQGILLDGRTAVIFSPQDITAGLVGFSSGCVDGYSPKSAYAIARNVILDKGR